MVASRRMQSVMNSGDAPTGRPRGDHLLRSAVLPPRRTPHRLGEPEALADQSSRADAGRGDASPRHGGDVDYAMLVKIYGASGENETRYSPAKCLGGIPTPVVGDPDAKHISTSYVERQNLTCG